MFSGPAPGETEAMTTTGDFPQPAQGGSQYSPPGGVPYPGASTAPKRPGTSGDSFFQSIRGLAVVRTDERWVGGVASGVAKRFGVDPLIVRGLWAVSLLFAGIGLIFYGVAWALLPEERDGRIHAQEMVRGNFDVALAGAGILVLSGFGWGGMSFLAFGSVGGWFFGWMRGLLWLAALILAILTITFLNKNKHTWRSQPAGGNPYSPHDGVPAAASPRDGSHAAPGYNGAGPLPYGGPQPQPWVPVPLGPKVASAGMSLVGIVLGVWVLAVAGLLLAQRAGAVSGSVFLLSLGMLVVLCALGVAVSGFRGRKGSPLGAIAVVALILSLPTGAMITTGFDFSDAAHSGFGEGTFTPTTLAEAEDGFAMLAGEWTIDLRELPDHTGLVTVPVTMAAGDLTITIPSGTPWTVDYRIAAGALNITTPNGTVARAGLLNPENSFSNHLVDDGAAPTLELTVRAAAGQVTIIEETP